jgi:hypothetical protein
MSTIVGNSLGPSLDKPGIFARFLEKEPQEDLA